MNRVKPFTSAIVVCALALLAFAPAAIAADGVGLWGPTTDKDVTMWGFGVLAFFSTLVIVLGVYQLRSETRKERQRAELERVRRPVD